MIKMVLSSIGACMLGLSVVASGLCEDLAGAVSNGYGQPMPGVKIVARSADGRVTQITSSGADGQYHMTGLIPGDYLITLDPSGAGVQGQTVEGYLGTSGLTVNWSVAPGLAPVAAAHPGTQRLSPSASNPSRAVIASSADSPPGCKGMPGPPCGPKKSKKRDDDEGHGGD